MKKLAAGWLVSVAIAVLWQPPLAGQVGPTNRARSTRPAPAAAASARTAIPDTARQSELRIRHRPAGDWGGPACPPAADLKALVDDYLATPHPGFPGAGSTVPGVSVSIHNEGCGTFTYAAGLANVEHGRELTPATLMRIASMTKVIVAAVALKLDEDGVFGPLGLDTPVDRLLTPAQIAALTTGADPAAPRCPGQTWLRNRETLEWEFKSYSCPDLSRVTLRHLMISNHGMYDFLNEVALPNGRNEYWDGVFFDVYKALGLDPAPPVNGKTGFEYLASFGLKHNDAATIGGNLRFRDLESSVGNTGMQLLGVILEHQTGRTLGKLVQTLVTQPLGIEHMPLSVNADRRGLTADGYEIVTGDPDFAAVYPLRNLNGHAAVNTLSLGSPADQTLAGGAAGLLSTPRSYAVFLRAFVEGGLLGPRGQAALESSYLYLPDYSLPEVNAYMGFGLGKDEFRGWPGLPDHDFLAHSGQLPGAQCFNAVVTRIDGSVGPIHGALCINTLLEAYPSAQDLWLNLIDRILIPENFASSSAKF